MRHVRFALAALAISLACGPAAADPSADDRAAVQAVIKDQVAAFARDDGPGAYAFASDAIRELFTSADAFMAMVRAGYAPVYRPKSFVFGPISSGDGATDQEAFVTDVDGVDWIARYTLTRDAAGRWRISGCRLIRNDRQSV